MEPSILVPEKTGQIRNSNKEADYREIFAPGNVCNLVGLQIKSTFYQVNDGLMTLLRRCLESESRNCRSVISGYIDHHQSLVSEDAGWGCGWRNIQMLSSHLLMLRKEARAALFGGCGFVPDIPSLQRWLEIAWERGFDTPGSNSFNQKIYGSRKWIGTTECATLLRSFGLRARIIDFDSLASSSSTSYAKCEHESSRGEGTRKLVCGPMDKFLHQKKYDNSQVNASSCGSWPGCHDLSTNSKTGNSLFVHDIVDKCKEEITGPQILVDWVWHYFTKEVRGKMDSAQHVLLSEKTWVHFFPPFPLFNHVILF